MNSSSQKTLFDGLNSQIEGATGLLPPGADISRYKVLIDGAALNEYFVLRTHIFKRTDKAGEDPFTLEKTLYFAPHQTDGAVSKRIEDPPVNG